MSSLGLFVALQDGPLFAVLLYCPAMLETIQIYEPFCHISPK
jgi:hypothetical protein